MNSYSPDAAAPWAEFADEIEHIIVGKQVEKIGAYAFDGLDKVTSISFEDNSQLTEIEEYAFSGCKEITFVELPDKLEKIGEAAFSDCKKLAKVVLSKSVDEFETITIKPEDPETIIARESIDVFDDCDLTVLVLVVESGSASEQYALENGVTVQYTERR